MLLRNPFTRDARVLREARSLVAAGHDVTVIAVRAGDLPVREERDGIHVRRTVSAGSLAGPTIAGAAGGDRRGRRLPRPAALVRLRDEVLDRGFRRAAANVAADVYHAHDLNTLGPALAAARRSGARVVYDAHELYPDLPGLGAGERARWARLERRIIAAADAVVVPSPARGEELVRRYGIPEPVVVMNCPPAGPAPDPRESPLWSLRRPNETLLVYAGGYTPSRGLDLLARAVGRIPGCRLAMLGWGPLEPELRAIARTSDDRVVLCGSVEPDGVVAAVSGADVGLAPYIPSGRNDQLAAPNKLFEYLHAGLAVAASDLPDIRLVVTDSNAGVLFDAADPESIIAAVSSLVRDPGRMAEAKAAARAAAPRYTWDRQEKALITLYEGLAR